MANYRKILIKNFETKSKTMSKFEKLLGFAKLQKQLKEFEYNSNKIGKGFKHGKILILK